MSATDDTAWPDTDLHAVTQRMLARARALGVAPFHQGTPEAARALYAAARALIGPGEAVRETRSLEIPTRDGTIQARLSLPDAPVAGLAVYLHGGGWVVGALPDGEPLSRTVAARSGCAVLAVDYRLAPEHPFPAAPDDCEDALLWASRHRLALGGEGPLTVFGDSAGANLATVAAARVAGRVAIAGQVLVYPVADSDFARASYRRYGTGLPLAGADMAWFFRHYAGQADWRDPAIAPLRAETLERLPPTVMLLAEHDVLRDEGEAYASRLRDAGKLVAVHRYAGVTHGFLRYHALIDTADRAVSDLAGALRAFCRPHSRPG